MAQITQSYLEIEGIRQEGKSRVNMLKYNAQIARNKGIEEEYRMKRAAQQKRREGKVAAAKTRAAVAKSGIDLSGSPLLVLSESQANYELDALTLQREAVIGRQAGIAESNMLLTQAKYERQAYRRRVTAATIKAVTGMAKQAASVASGGAGAGGGTSM